MPIALRCLTLLALAIGLAFPAQAQVTVTQSTSSDITAHGVCLTVTNNCDGDIMIPNASSAEFYGVPNVWGSNSCVTADFCGNAGNDDRTMNGGYYHICAIKNDRTAMCWGVGGSGRLGYGGTSDQTTPIAVTGTDGWRSVAAGNYFSCGITTTGVAKCWGQGGMGQLGDGTTTASQLTPSTVSGGYTWRSIGTGGLHACGIRTDGVAMCWGYQANGRLGNGVTAAASITTPVVVLGGYSWRSISVGIAHNCGVRTDGVAMCWGSGSAGRLGDGGTSDQSSPVLVSGGYSWKSINAGSNHTCGIRTDDVAMCWGVGSDGQRGDGTTTLTQTTPVAISGSYSWKALSANSKHSCGIRTDGVAMCWGRGDTGQRGDGDYTTTISTPVIVSGGYSWSRIGIGTDFSCGIRTDGVAMCWGWGQYGQLGNGTTTLTQNTPVTVSGGYTW